MQHQQNLYKASLLNTYTLSLPLRVAVSKSQSFSLNLNAYRNAFYHTLNKAKVEFEEVVREQVEALPVLNRCHLHYVLYPKTKRLCDVSNICSITDKFFSDALVNAKKLIDDNYTFIENVTYSFGKIDPDNPRVEVTITNFEDKKEMQIILVEKEIKKALGLYLKQTYNIPESLNQDIELTATRGVEGTKATINVTDPEDNLPTTTSTDINSSVGESKTCKNKDKTREKKEVTPAVEIFEEEPETVTTISEDKPEEIQSFASSSIFG